MANSEDEHSCALCHRAAALRKSHIIPAFLYEPLFDNQRRLRFMTTSPEGRDSRPSSGDYERLLCEDCELQLSKWEGYAKGALQGGSKDAEVMLTKDVQHPDLVVARGVDYQRFKLFQLSILWKASISQRAFFAGAKLGHHQDVVRRMLLASNPGPADAYPCIMFGMRLDGHAATGLMASPVRMRLDGHRAIKFVFGGFMWVYVTSSHGVPSYIRNVTLQATGVMPFLVRDANEFEDIRSFFETRRRLGRKVVFD